MGVPMEPGELKEPVALNDIRRWVQAMHYPNPLHYDERWAAESRFGEIVAPQSFTVACDTSHGCSPAQVGMIPNSHLIFGGDDWWFFGPRVWPGDKMRLPPDALRLQGHRDKLRRAHLLPARRHALHQPEGRAGRAAAVDGDPLPGARGQGEGSSFSEHQAKSRSGPTSSSPSSRSSKLEFIDQIQSLRHDKRLFDSVKVGDRLAGNVLGPHSLASFTTEWRAYPMTTWGATAKGPTTVRAEELGYTKEMAGFEGDRRMERVNPELTDGAYYGPSRGHLQPRWAQHVGMPRGYGYGASMGAWVLDYVAAWAGEWGYDHPLERPVPQPGLHRRRHLPQRRGGRQAGRAQAQAPRAVKVELRNQDDASCARPPSTSSSRTSEAPGGGAGHASASRDQRRRSGGSALAASSSACSGNHSPAPGSTRPHSGSTVSPAGPSPRVHSPSDSPGDLDPQVGVEQRLAGVERRRAGRGPDRAGCTSPAGRGRPVAAHGPCPLRLVSIT